MSKSKDEYTLQELADAIGRKYQVTRYHLRSLGIEPKRRLGRNNLYGPDALQQLKTKVEFE